MKDSGEMVSLMVRVISFTQMEVSITVTGSMEKPPVME